MILNTLTKSQTNKDILIFTIINLATVLYVYRIDVGPVNVSLIRILFPFFIVFSINRTILNVSRYLIVLGLLALLALPRWIEMLINSDPANVKRVGSYISLLCLFYSVYVMLDNREKILLFMKCHIAVSVIPFSIAVFQLLTGNLPFQGLLDQYSNEYLQGRTYFSTAAVEAGYQDYYRLTSSFFDPNFYGYYCLTVVISALTLIIHYRKASWYYPIIIVFNVVALLGTSSRTSFYGLLIVGLLFLRMQKRSRYMTVTTTIAAIGITLFIADFMMGSGWTDYAYKRFFLKEEGAGASADVFYGRIDYFYAGIEVFLEQPMFGAGSSTFLSVLGGDIPSAHNAFLTWLALYGVVGFLCSVGFVLYPLIMLAKANSYRLAKRIEFKYLVAAFILSTICIYLMYDSFELMESQYVYYALVYAVTDNMIKESPRNPLMQRTADAVRIC